MANIYYDSDADLGILAGKRIGIIGYGSQGHAHALNLMDSGQDVVVGLPAWDDEARKAATDAGCRVVDIPEAARNGDIVMILIPDEVQKKVYEEEIAPGLAEGNALGFAHGFNIRFGQIVPPKNVDVFMVAPKSPGHLVRRVFQEGGGTPCLLAVHQDHTGNAKATGLAYARGIGGTRAGVIETTFNEETETDLFGEQAVLCGGTTALIKAGFETLVEAGYQPEIAYFECLHELKLIVDLIYEGGLKWMRYSVSNTAEYGDLTRGPVVITDETRKIMKKLLKEVQDGTFAREWIKEGENNLVNFEALRKKEAQHQIEIVGEKLRGMMSWLKKG